MKYAPAGRRHAPSTITFFVTTPRVPETLSRIEDHRSVVGSAPFVVTSADGAVGEFGESGWSSGWSIEEREGGV